MTHSVVSSRSALSAKVSLPLIVTPPSGGGLTSRITSLPAAMVTLSPARGTFLSGQLARSDQRVGFTGFSAAPTTADTLPSKSAGTSNARRNEQFFFLMAYPL